MYLVLVIKNNGRLLKTIKDFRHLSNIRNYSDSNDKPTSRLDERIRDKFKKLKNDQQSQHKISEFSHPKRQAPKKQSEPKQAGQFGDVQFSNDINQFMPKTNEQFAKAKLLDPKRSKSSIEAYIKELLKLTQTPEEYYFKRDQMNSNTNALVYCSTLFKKYEIFFIVFVFALPFFFYLMYRVYTKKYNRQVFDELYSDDEDAKYHFYIVITVATIFALQLYLLVHYLRTHPSVIYFNAKNNKFTIVLKKFPMSNSMCKLIVDSGELQLDPPRNIFFSLFQTNTKLPSRKKRLYINNDLFTKPLYSNLLFGFTKPNR